MSLDRVPALARRGVLARQATRDGARRLKIEGTIDERFEVEQVLGDFGGDQPIILDVEGISKITSYGVLQWARLIGNLRAPYYFLGCRPAFVYQLNVVADFGGAGELVSFYLPYLCARCGHELEHLLDQRRDRARVEGLAPPALACRECGAPMEFDDVPETYFAFALRAPPKRLPAAVAALVDDCPALTDVAPAGAVIGGYRLLERIAYGGTAEIFLAVDARAPERTVALKRMLAHGGNPRALDDALRLEERIGKAVRHPNVVRVFEGGDAGGRAYLTMEHVAGRNLAAILARAREREEAMPVSLASFVVREVAAGLEALHAAEGEGGEPLRIVHGDLSPDNVLVSDAGAVKLSDFGAATLRGAARAREEGAIEGKTPYVAPELILGAETDRRGDVFAAGLILYECLIGESPYLRGSTFSTMQAVLHEPVPVPSARRRGIPAALDAVVARATARDREARHPSAAELADDLAAAVPPAEGERAALAAWIASLF